MSSNILTVEAAKAVGIPVVENGRYTQALHDVVVGYRAARRSGSANSKTKAEVNLSGSKPWRQKGTGRARAGYKSSPVWVGGGVVFGPKPRDYRKTLSKSVRRMALKKAISERIKGLDVIQVESVDVSSGKTKDFVSWITGLAGTQNGLVISSHFSEQTYFAARNLGSVRLVSSLDVNAEDLLRHKKVIVTNAALEEIAKRING
jgi:large subunit ribosomal protein L4